MPCEMVYQTRLDDEYAVPTVHFSLEVHLGQMPGPPNANPSPSTQRYCELISFIVCTALLIASEQHIPSPRRWKKFVQKSARKAPERGGWMDTGRILES